MNLFKCLICILLSLAVLTLGVGYAQLSSTLSSQVTVTGEMQKGVFISSVLEDQGVTINTYYSTVLDSQVILADSNDKKTLTITLYNNTPDNYAFKDINYDAEIINGYTNSNITFNHTLQQYQKIESKKTLEFSITFIFNESYTATTSESLQSIINFNFGLWGEEDNTDYETFLSSFLVDLNKGYGLNDTDNGDKGPAVIAGIKKEKILYPHTKIQGGNLTHLSNGITENLTFIYEYVSDNTFYLYTYENKYCDALYNGEQVDCYKTILEYNTASEMWEMKGTYSGKAKIDLIENHYYIDHLSWIGNMI